MKFDIDHFGKFIHRSPVLPINEYYKASSGDIYLFLKDFFSNRIVQTALYNSSYNFYNEVLFFLEGKYDGNDEKLYKFYSKALKYANRMCTRSTPFGSFSGCTVGDIEYKTSIKRTEDGRLIRKHRLDYEFLYGLVVSLLKNTNIKEHIKYYPNDSIYIVGDKYRYVDFNTENGELNYLLSSLEKNEYVDEILEIANTGSYYETFVKYLVEEGNEKEDSVNFLNEVIDSNIILPEIHPNTIGVEYQYHVLDILEKTIKRDGIDHEIKKIYNSLKDIVQKLDSISDKDYSVDHMEDIISAIKSLPVDFDTGNYLQIDTSILYQDNHLSHQDVQNIKKGLRDYFKISQKSFENRRLSEFIKKFEERYEDTPVKLLEVLDPEFGLGYGDYSNEFLVITPIVDHIPVSNKTSDKSSFVWNNKIHSFLFKKIFEAHKNNADEVELLEEEINDFEFDIQDIPSTFVAFFNMYNTAEGYLYNFKNWSSDTASSIIGRFSTLDEAFHELLSNIDNFEKTRLTSNQILAEINHLSGLRIGNITTRTSFREYEIPYITVDNNNGLKKIYPNDIYVRVFNGKVRLFDIRSGKEILPVLSNAHNYNNNPLPLYRFLSDIQNHSQINDLSLNIDLGIIPTLFSHIPRIRYKNFIFRTATWILQAKDFKETLEINDKNKRKEAFIAKLESQRIPKVFYATDGDNKLFLDFHSLYDASELIFKDELRKKNNLIIEEYIPQSYHEELKASANGFYCNEMIIPFKNNASKVFNYSDFGHLREDILQNEHIDVPIGNNCMYMKIFIGTISRNKILNEKFLYFITQLRNENLFDYWFFIRFSENNNPHLRVRFFKDQIDNNRILNIYNEVFNEEIKSNIIYKSELTLYKKEIIRYGGSELIGYAERIFEKDSELYLNLSLLLEKYGLNEYYWIFIMKTMLIYLRAFDLKDKEKIVFCTENKIYFAEKFNANKEQNKEILLSYKQHKKQIEEFLDDHILRNKYPEIADLFDTFFLQLKQITDDSYQNKENKKSYLMSLVHMSVLRSTISKNVKHEYILYCFLEMYSKNLMYSKNV
ncbi:lantibiotic dehydratase [Chryseobacterium sp. NRRL B-14859]|uniref:lantibiotic dehydratase n=1 Tax=Chryseobacterium sp. NRRL B-14859 TaxID=1562763 RepID=UPI00339A0DED